MRQLFRMIIADIVKFCRRTGGQADVGRRLVDQPQHNTDHIVDLGKVAPHPAMIKQLDRGTLQDRPGKQENRHVGPSPRPVDGKEPQARHWKSIEMAVGMRDQLIGLLCGGVEADRMIGFVVLRKRQLAVGAVDRRRRCIDQMATSVVSATFQHIDETFEIGVDIGMRMIDRVTHTCLRRQMDHSWKAVFCEQALH